MMTANIYRYLRNSAALLIIASGVGQVAALWLRELTAAALADALLGAVYIIIGIGLFGRSRFTLFMAMAVPGATTIWLLRSQPQIPAGYAAHIMVDILIVLISAAVLWQVRDEPSV